MLALRDNKIRHLGKIQQLNFFSLNAGNIEYSVSIFLHIYHNFKDDVLHTKKSASLLYGQAS